MNIRFVSTMTPDDEEKIAPVVLRAAATILDETGLAYTLRIETTNEKVFQHHHPPVRTSATPGDGSPTRSPAMYGVVTAEH